MSNARSRRAFELFEIACDLAGAERTSFLERECNGERELRAEVESLLAADRGPEGSAYALLRPALAALVVDSKAPNWLPERIAGFRVVRRIGEGGMGVVFEAEQDIPRRRVALKMMHPTLSSGERARRFKLEAEVLGRLHHPGIAQIYEAGTFDLGRGAQPYFAMELVDGVDLRFYADRERLGIEAKLALVAEIADAVQHAHERGVVHRDLKPENVLVDALGQPKVLDFGIARASDTSDLLSTIVTQTGELVGTLAYMAPEQLSGKPEAVTAKVDVYALGVVLYQLLSGRLPHEIAGLPLTAAMRVLAHEEPATLERLNPALRGDVATIVAKAMEKDPSRRYSSAAALASDLRRYLEHRPITARPASALYRMQRAIRRNRSLAIGASAVFLTLVAGLSGTLWQAHAAERRAIEARAAEASALRSSYSANMRGACDALDRNQVGGARAYLRETPEKLRGWEWRVCNARLDSTIRVHAPSMPGVALGTANWKLALLSAPDYTWHLTVDERSQHAIRRWDSKSGTELGACWSTDPEGGPWLCDHRTQLAPDGAHVALVARRDTSGPRGTLRFELWNVISGQCDFTATTNAFDAHTTSSARPSADGERVALCGANHVSVWMPRSGRVIGPVPCEQDVSHSVFSRDGRFFAASESNGRIVVFDASDLAQVNQLDGLTNLGTAIEWSADGSRVFAASIDGNVCAWDLAQRPGRLLMTLPHPESVGDARLSPDGRRIATADAGRSLRVWDTETGALLGVFGDESLVPYTVAFLGENEVAGMANDGSVRTWCFDPRANGVLRGHTSFVYDVAPIESLGLLVSGGWDGWNGRRGALRFWDIESGDEVASCLGKDQYVLSMSASAVRPLVALSVGGCGANDARCGIELLDLDRVDVTRVPGDPGIAALEFAPDGNELAWIDASSVGVVDVARGETVRRRTLDPNTRYIRLAWSHDGSRICVCGRIEEERATVATDTAVVLDSRTLETVVALPGVVGLDAAFSPDDQLLAIAGYDGPVFIFDALTGAQRAKLVSQASGLLCLEFSPDGRRLVGGGGGRAVRVWDVPSLDYVGRLGGYDDYVRSVAWDSRGERLFTGSGDGTVRVWDARSPRERMAAVEARRAIVERIEPYVTQLAAELDDPTRVVAAIESAAALSARERQIARQIALKLALDALDPK